MKKVSKDFPGGVCEELGVSESRLLNLYVEMLSSLSAFVTSWVGLHAKE